MQCNAIKSNNILFFLYFLLWIKWNDVFHLKICYFILMLKQRRVLWWAERWHLASHHMRIYCIATHTMSWCHSIWNCFSWNSQSQILIFYHVLYVGTEIYFLWNTFSKWYYCWCQKYESLFIICNFSMWKHSFQVYILLAKSLSHLILGQKQD